MFTSCATPLTSILHQLAAKVADVEGRAAQEAFAEIADTISALLARHGARATMRHAGGPRVAASPEAARAATALWQAAGGSAPPMADDDSASEGVREEREDGGDGGEIDVPMA